MIISNSKLQSSMDSQSLSGSNRTISLLTPFSGLSGKDPVPPLKKTDMTVGLARCHASFKTQITLIELETRGDINNPSKGRASQMVLVVKESTCSEGDSSLILGSGRFSGINLGFPGSTSSKESACQCRRHKRCGVYPCVGKIPWCM